MDCIIVNCVREADDQFCKKHQKAVDNIENSFEDWKKAYGKSFTYQQYLERLANDADLGSGDLVVDVAKHLLGHNL